MPGSAARGRALAERESAAVVVWISQSDDGFALWVYDAVHDRVLTRRLDRGPPFDEAAAAAVALSIKAFLRHGSAAPDSERVASEAPREISLGVALGLRAFASDRDDVVPRLSLALAIHPNALEGIVGFGFIASSGSGLEANVETFTGRWHDVRAALFVRARARIASMLELGARLELGAAASWLDGVVLPVGRAAADVRVDPALGAMADAGLWLGPGLRLGLGTGLVAIPTIREYLVRGQTVLRLGPVALRAELVLEIPLG